MEHPEAPTNGLLGSLVSKASSAVGANLNPFVVELNYYAFGEYKYQLKKKTIAMPSSEKFADLQTVTDAKDFFDDLFKRGPILVKDMMFKAKYSDREYYVHEGMSKNLSSSLSHETLPSSLVQNLTFSGLKFDPKDEKKQRAKLCDALMKIAVHLHVKISFSGISIDMQEYFSQNPFKLKVLMNDDFANNYVYMFNYKSKQDQETATTDLSKFAIAYEHEAHDTSSGEGGDGDAPASTHKWDKMHYFLYIMTDHGPISKRASYYNKKEDVISLYFDSSPMDVPISRIFVFNATSADKNTFNKICDAFEYNNDTFSLESTRNATSTFGINGHSDLSTTRDAANEMSDIFDSLDSFLDQCNIL